MGNINWVAPIVIGAVLVSGCGSGTSTGDSRPAGTVPATAAPTAGTAASDQTSATGVLFEDPFDDDRNGWGVIDHPDFGSALFDGGDYVWNFRGSLGHLLPAVLGEQYDRGELEMADVVVHADATVLRGGGVIGVFCRETPDDDAEWEWYEFVARDGYAAIRRADTEGNIEPLAETRDIELPAGEQVTIDATCASDSEGGAQLSLALNAASPQLEVTTDDPLGTGPPGLQAWTFPIHDEMDIRWHGFSISSPES